MRSLLFAVAIVSGASLAHPVDDLDVSKPLEAKQLKGLPLDDLRFLRNSIYARHGRAFESASLTTFFKSRDWYVVDPKYSDAMITPVEKANIELITRTEKSKGGAWTEGDYLEWLAAQLGELVPDGSVGLEKAGTGGWEVPLTCGEPSVKTSIATSPTQVTLAETYVEGGEAVFGFTVLLRDGAGQWIGLELDRPKEKVLITKEGGHTQVGDHRYARYSSARALPGRDSVSAAECRKLGH